MTEIECEQRKLCKVYNADYYPCPFLQKIGIASNIESGIFPINGLRHLPVGDTCGWYLWAGGEIDRSPDFFHPVHVLHLDNTFPSILKFLGLAPGWRFLMAPGHEDVWYDPSLLIE